MVVRALVIVTVLLAGIGAYPHTSSASPSPDLRVLRAASGLLGHRSVHAVRGWLLHQPSVRSVTIAADGTVDMRFGDGTVALIVPRAQHTVRMPLSTIGRMHPMSRPHAPGPARAIVLEPFARELGLGPNAGDPEVAALRGDGFAVDQAYDTQVTVGLMSTVPAYNVTYMHTHSGTDAKYGGVVITGELANGDPAAEALRADNSVVYAGVAGSTQAYYGLTGNFFVNHAVPFATSSIVFINGCQLRGTGFYNQIAGRGIGVLVSWDQEVSVQDGYFSGAAFFHFLTPTTTVADAITQMKAAGFGTSTQVGKTATLGYEGDGTITLQRAAAGSPPTVIVPTARPTATGIPPPPTTTVPTATAVPPTPTSTSTPTATATATSTPLPPPVVALQNLVKPGAKQIVHVRFDPNVDVHFAVQYPNGDLTGTTGNTGANGTATYSFVQPASKITRFDRSAIVTVDITTPKGHFSVTSHYTIAYNQIDVAVTPREQVAGQPVKIWVHTGPNRAVNVIVKVSKKKQKRYFSITGLAGWTHVTFRPPAGSASGKRIVIRAETTRNGTLFHSSTSLTVS